jgi:predicted nucleic acid-binding Zn ribbon protein
MNPHNQKTLKEALREMVKVYQMKPKMAQTRLKAEWESIMGKTIAKYTEKVFVKDKILFVYVNNASLKNELQYNKATVIKKINEAIEAGYIEDVLVK